MPRLKRKSFATPDEIRRFPLGRVDIVNLDETVLGCFEFEPGWRWSMNVQPIAGTASCQHRHVGYVMTGHLHVLMDAGTGMDILAGDAYEIPPGHDDWVVGAEPWRCIESGSVRGLAIHVAARVAALAGPNDVFVSATTHDSADGSGIEFSDEGTHELKGLKGQRAIFALRSGEPRS